MVYLGGAIFCWQRHVLEQRVDVLIQKELCCQVNLEFSDNAFNEWRLQNRYGNKQRY